MRDILKEGFEAGAKGLRDFGYPDVTASMIEEAHGRWQRGEEPEGVIQSSRSGMARPTKTSSSTTGGARSGKAMPAPATGIVGRGRV
jgi:hypothetical protein